MLLLRHLNVFELIKKRFYLKKKKKKKFAIQHRNGALDLPVITPTDNMASVLNERQLDDGSGFQPLQSQQ